MSEITITVRGSDEVRLNPELAVAHVSLTTDGPSRGGVVEAITALAVPVRADLTARKDAGSLSEWNSQRVSIWSDRPWNNDGKQLDLVHHASVELTATFTDFVALSDWLNALSENDNAQVGQIDWQLTPETRTKTEREVATAAVAAAVERATAYAQALGHATVTPQEIADLGLLSDGAANPGREPSLMKSRMMAADAAAGSGGIEFQPDAIVVSASVEARFIAS